MHILVDSSPPHGYNPLFSSKLIVGINFVSPRSQLGDTIIHHVRDQARYTSGDVESGLSSRIRSKGPPKPQTPEDDSLDQKKYTFYLDVVIPDKVDTPKTEISVPNNMKVYDAVKLALQRFKLELELLGVAVGQNVDLYNPRLSKKNGKAKMDMPCSYPVIQLSTSTRSSPRSESRG